MINEHLKLGIDQDLGSNIVESIISGIHLEECAGMQGN